VADQGLAATIPYGPAAVKLSRFSHAGIVSGIAMLLLLLTAGVYTFTSAAQQRASTTTLLGLLLQQAGLHQAIDNFLARPGDSDAVTALRNRITELQHRLATMDAIDALSARRSLRELELAVEALASLRGTAYDALTPVPSEAALTARLRTQETDLTGALINALSVSQTAADPSQQRALLMLLGIALLSILALLTGAILLHRRVMVPLRALSRGVSALQRGDLAHVVAYSEDDEIGALAAAFNAMTQQLRLDAAAIQQQQARVQSLLDRQIAVVNSLPANIALVDNAGNIVETNASWDRFGFDQAVAGHAGKVEYGNYLAVCDAVTGPEQVYAAEAATGLRDILAGRRPDFTSVYPCHSPERERWFRMVATPIPAAAGPAGAVVMHLDITERELADRALRQTAFLDPVTGQLSRAGLIAHWPGHSKVPARDGDHGECLVIADVRRLNAINQSCGYSTADHLLSALGQRLHTALLPDELLGSLGSGQFALLLGMEAHGFSGTHDIVAWFRALCSQPISVDRQTLYIDLRIAIVPMAGLRPTQDVLLRRGQLTLQKARDDRLAWLTFDASFEAEIVERAWIIDGLRTALQEEQFELHYQPKVDLRSGAILSAEALLRWRHPELGLQPPDRFIPIAENSQQIIAIGEWALRQACQSLRHWIEAGLSAARVAVNVSMVQFMHSDVVSTIERIINEVGIDPTRLSLELTESIFEREGPLLLTQLQHLRALGVRLSLDDFGTGYSSLAHLQRYPFDEIKIDRAFVRDCDTNSHNQAVIRMITRLAAGLDCTVVAEGIETAAQRDFLLQLGCTVGQGFFYSMPLVDEDFHWLLSHRQPLPLAAERTTP